MEEETSCTFLRIYFLVPSQPATSLTTTKNRHRLLRPVRRPPPTPIRPQPSLCRPFRPTTSENIDFLILPYRFLYSSRSTHSMSPLQDLHRIRFSFLIPTHHCTPPPKPPKPSKPPKLRSCKAKKCITFVFHEKEQFISLRKNKKRKLSIII